MAHATPHRRFILLPAFGCAIIAAYCLAVPAHANDLPGFGQLDNNANGELTVGEFVAADLTPTQFKSADSNNNQRVSAAEYSEFQHRVAKQQRRPGSGPHPPRG